MENQPDITQANVDTLITVYGGSGFLGRHVIRALCKRGYRIRVAVRRPELAGHLQPLGRVGQIHAVQANLRYPSSVEAAARGADVADQPGRHPVRARTPALRRGAGVRRRIGGAGGVGLWRAAGARVGDRRRRERDLVLCPRQGHRREAGVRRQAGGDGVAAVGGVRTGGRLLQPLCGAGQVRAGAAAGRRRAYAVPAGLCGRRRGRRGRSGRRPRQVRQHLRARRSRGEDVQGTAAIRARGHRPQPALGAAAVRAGRGAGLVPAVPAEAAADARPGRAAQDRQCRERRRQARGPHARRRSASRRSRWRRSRRRISGGSARPASSRSRTASREHRHRECRHQCRGPAPDRAAAPAARAVRLLRARLL